MMVDKNTAPSLEYNGKTYYFMNEQHLSRFKNEPEKFLGKTKESMDH